MDIFTILYLAVFVIEIIIRTPLNRIRRQQTMKDRRVTAQEKALLGLLFFGILFFPIIYAATDWLSFADYRLPALSGWLGIALLAAGLFVFWRAHADLGANWSPTLEIRAGHELITRGIYGLIRHPMYASQWLVAIAQPLVLQNWIAGFAGLVTFIPFYFLRVRAEEALMIETFGDRYRAYMHTVGGVIPKVSR